MKVEKLLISKSPINLVIKEVTLLSKGEAKMLGKDILKCRDRWWLRTQGKDNSFFAPYVNAFAEISTEWASSAYYGIRPAIKIANPESAGIKNGDKIQFAGETWTVVLDDIILCDNIVGESVFRAEENVKDANNYEASDAKKALLRWAKEKGIKTES